MLHHHHHHHSGRRVSARDSSEFSDARETKVTIAIIEPTKSQGQTSIQVWLWRAVCLVLVLTMGVGLWKLATRKSTKEAGSPLSSQEKAANAAEVAKWNIQYRENGNGKLLTVATWKAQLQRILADFEDRYPEKFAALPFDIMEHYRWRVKHKRSFGASDTELEVYSMLYYDWSSHKEEEPFAKLLDGTAISERRALFEGDKDSSYSMDRVLIGDKRVKRKPFPGSRTENRTVPQDIISGFTGSDETARVAKSIFEKWEGRKGGPRLCVEDCAMRLGLLTHSGSYWAVMKAGHTVHRNCGIFERLNHAFLDALLRNNAFRNYLAWKGLRKYSDGGWGTLFYNHVNSKPYEMLFFVKDKYTEGFLTADGDAWYSYSYNFRTAYVPNGNSSHSLRSRPKRLADSLVLKHEMWGYPGAKIEFPNSSV